MRWTINTLPSRFVVTQRQEGLKLYYPNYSESTMLYAALRRAAALFADEINSPLHAPIVGVFCYDMQLCGGAYHEADAICVFTDIDGPNGFYCIGISKQGLARGSAYAQLLVLHELAHVFAETGHSIHYEAKLDELLARYNAEFGMALVNDYVSLNDECP